MDKSSREEDIRSIEELWEVDKEEGSMYFEEFCLDDSEDESDDGTNVKIIREFRKLEPGDDSSSRGVNRKNREIAKSEGNVVDDSSKNSYDIY